MTDKDWIKSVAEPKIEWGPSGTSISVGKDGMIAYGTWPSTDDLADYVTIKTETKTNEDKINTLIKAVSTLIQDNERLKSENDMLVYRITELEKANINRQMEISEAHINIHTAKTELINMINEKLDKA